jgi:hypothetical protein
MKLGGAGFQFRGGSSSNRRAGWVATRTRTFANQPWGSTLFRPGVSGAAKSSRSMRATSVSETIPGSSSVISFTRHTSFPWSHPLAVRSKATERRRFPLFCMLSTSTVFRPYLRNSREPGWTLESELHVMVTLHPRIGRTLGRCEQQEPLHRDYVPNDFSTIETIERKINVL